MSSTSGWHAGSDCRRAAVVAAAFLLAVAQPGQCELSLGPGFGGEMVLQRDVPLPIWGRATPGETVSVTFRGLLRQATADGAGRWRVELPPLAADTLAGPLVVRSANESRQLDDLLVGDVWLCAGQSNMEFPLSRSTTATEALQRASYPQLRLLQRTGAARGSRRHYSAKMLAQLPPDRFCSGQWETCTPQSAGKFSAVGFFFGEELQRQLEIPVGLINVSLGGTPAEAWVRHDALAQDPRLRPLVEGNWLENQRLSPWCRERAAFNLQRLVEESRELPGDERGPYHSFKPGFMWDAAVQPLLPFPIRGVIWYQGESNADTAERVALHEQLFESLVRDWRACWRLADLPFLFVQLPGMGRAEWPQFRNQQRLFLQRIPRVGMAVTIDLGHPTDVHPPSKRPVGERLARWALATEYGRDDLVHSGPLYRSSTVRSSELLLEFEAVGSGLVCRDGEPLRHFELAGPEGSFRPAAASIRGRAVAVRAPGIAHPRQVRYAWCPFPEPPVNFYNVEGLPASPFSATVGPEPSE